MSGAGTSIHTCKPGRHFVHRFCCDDPPREVIKSDSNEMLVLFRTFHESRVCDDIKYPWKCQILYTGFMAKYHIGKNMRYPQGCKLPVCCKIGNPGRVLSSTGDTVVQGWPFLKFEILQLV